MLKKFFTQLLSSFMGAWLALVLFGAVAVIVVISVFASIGNKQPTESITSGSILRINLDGVITETETAVNLDYPTLIKGSLPKSQALNNLVRGLKAGAVNDDIKALYLNCKGAEASPATLHVLRQAVIDFKKSGKKVYAYSDSYSQGDYYVASVADSIFLNSMGGVAIHGIAGSIPYYKNLLDKIGVTFQVFKVGTYKSAVEPMLYNEMSQPARAQLDTLYNAIWAYMSKEIEGSRKLSEGSLDTLVNNVIMLRNSGDVLKAKLVDRLVYRRNMKDILAHAAGVEPEKLNMVSTAALASDIMNMSSSGGSTEIAVLYATGEIEEGSKTGIDCEKIVPVVTELADKESVKGLVLRVNSPGGSVFGSEEIADALSYFQSKGKPVVVSMGDYAASGGYWISCKANKIYADPLTITGSIGIFGLIPELSKLAANIGVSPQTVSTNPNGVFPNLFAPMTEQQTAAMQTSIEELYDKFIERVATGRKLPADKVRSIAEGRVWDAQTAKSIGLVDELGSLDDAVKYAAKLAKIKDYSVRDYPLPESGFWEVLTTITEEKNMLAAKLSGKVNPDMLESVLRILTRKNTLALMPIIQFHN